MPLYCFYTCLQFKHFLHVFIIQITITEEQFILDDHTTVTSVSELCVEAKDIAQKLLNHYVKVQGLTISQVIINGMNLSYILIQDFIKTSTFSFEIKLRLMSSDLKCDVFLFISL